MRMTDTLAPCKAVTEAAYLCALGCLIGATKETGWKQLVDTHQISTREAGKSSCVFFTKNFPTLEKAIAVLTMIHRELPKVNVELQLTPDGIFDYGDGPGSYKMADWQKSMQYLPAKGMGCALLVDVQNIWRSLLAGESNETVKYLKLDTNGDVLVYDTNACIAPVARFPVAYSNKPTKRSKTIILNCHEHNVVWIETP